jgi:thiosulfate dehydrogenase [quinone] large subunit
MNNVKNVSAMVDIAPNHRNTVIDRPAPESAFAAASTYVAPAALTTRMTGVSGGPVTDPTARSSSPVVGYLLAGIRIALGWVFLWAFLDKLFGLGHATTAAKSWINGGSPTKGFLGSASSGPFSGFYHSIAGNGFIDVLFMVTLLGLGLALTLGIGLRVAAAAGAILTVMMWSAVLPPASNLFMDDHLIYAAVLILLPLLAAGDTFGLGRMWARTPLVRSNTWLR